MSKASKAETSSFVINWFCETFIGTKNSQNIKTIIIWLSKCIFQKLSGKMMSLLIFWLDISSFSFSWLAMILTRSRSKIMDSPIRAIIKITMRFWRTSFQRSFPRRILVISSFEWRNRINFSLYFVALFAFYSSGVRGTYCIIIGLLLWLLLAFWNSKYS